MGRLRATLARSESDRELHQHLDRAGKALRAAMAVCSRAARYTPEPEAYQSKLQKVARAERMLADIGHLDEASDKFGPDLQVEARALCAWLESRERVLDRIKYTERGIVSAALLAAMFELDEVLIGEAITSTAKETKAGTDWSARYIWEKNATKGSAFLFYSPPRPGLKTPSAGYQARVWYEGGQARRTTTWREVAEHQDVYEVAENTDIVQTGADLGFFWYDTILD